MRRSPLIVLLLLFLPAITRAQNHADFVLTKTFDHPFVGFGAEMNPYLYCAPNWPNEVNETNVKKLEREVIDLRPQHVRIFMLASWWGAERDEEVARRDPNVLASFYRTLQLAQRSGTSVNLTLWYGPFIEPLAAGHRFGALLDEIIRQSGMTCVKYVTIQNEVNLEGHRLPMADYNVLYRGLDEELKRRGLRDRITIVGGDLVGTNQGFWFNDLSEYLTDVCDAYSIHVYWDYWNPAKLSRRLEEVPPILQKLRSAGRKPLMVTEFGVRGHRIGNEEPGVDRTGQLITDTPRAALQAAKFDLLAVNLGYTATVQWDMYDAWYDRKMGYGLIGPIESDWERRPGYFALQLLTHTAQVGWHGVKVDGNMPDITAAAMRGQDGQGAIFLLNEREDDCRMTIGGLAASDCYTSRVWHGDRTPAAVGNEFHADNGGRLEITIPSHSMMTLSR